MALLYQKATDFCAVLQKAAALRESYSVTVLPQAKKLGRQLGALEEQGFVAAAFAESEEIKAFGAQQ